MSIDLSRVGELAAVVFDDLERAVATGELPEDAELVDAVLIVEVGHRDADGDRASTVSARVTGNRMVVGLGLLARAKHAMLSPHGDFGE